MTREQFEEKLRFFFYHEPFQPFMVTLREGRRITIGQPAFVFSGGTAGYFSADEGIIGFRDEEVDRIEMLIPEMQS